MKTKLFVIALVLVLAVLLPVVVTPVFAASALPQEAAPVLDIGAFLQWLIGGGGSILAVSWLLERMAWFQALSSNAKDNTIFGASVVVGGGALAVVNYVPANILSAIAPYFLVVASTFATVFIAKTFHRADKKA